MSNERESSRASRRYGYTVAAIKPFWRWAVAPGSAGYAAGMPFSTVKWRVLYYRKASALEFLAEARRELPWDRAVLLRRRWFRRVEVCDD